MIQEIKNLLLEIARRNGREVCWSMPFMRIGNYFYLGLWAFEDQSVPKNRFVLENQRVKEAIDLFPNFKEKIIISKQEVKITDKRLMPWKSEDRNIFFDHPMLEKYIREILIKDSFLENFQPAGDKDEIVVNVRRGDYYSVENNRQEYGINIQEYVDEALKTSCRRNGYPQKIIYVSDDLEWCKKNLLEISKKYANIVDFPERSFELDMRRLVEAQRLIIPNSTFSYWGGYIGDVLNPGREVIAPRIFRRDIDGNAIKAYQLKNNWITVDEIPSGWLSISK